MFGQVQQSAVVLSDINRTYDKLSTRYFNLLSRGADHPTNGFPTELDQVRVILNSMADKIQNYNGDITRLNDLVVSYGLKIKPILDKAESKFPAGTTVVPYSTVNTPGRLPETMLPKIPLDVMLDNSPEGVGQERGKELLEDTPWYFWKGMDLRIIGGALAVGAVALIFFARKKGQ
jgi:hypothetical protein